MLNFNNYKKVSYYLRHDAIVKRGAKNVHQLPKILRLTCSFSFSDFLRTNPVDNEKNQSLQQKIFLFLFFFTTFSPFIRGKKIGSKSEKEGTILYNFFFDFTTRKDIQNFLACIFVENKHKNSYKNLKVLKTKKKRNSFCLSINFKVALSSLSSIKHIFDIYSQNLSTQEVFLNINILLKDSNFFKNQTADFKNLFCFG